MDDCHRSTLSGTLGIIFALFWLLIAEDRPYQSKQMNSLELQHITGSSDRQQSIRSAASVRLLPTPFRSICTSSAMAAICVCSFAQSFVTIALITYLPLYYQTAMQFNLTSVSSSFTN